MDDQKCDCCEGTQILTPAAIANRPGLSALAYRVGTHARFLETMKARLSGMVVEIPDSGDPAKSTPTYPLRSLTTRAPNDASIALLDGWATVADVLTFYQERIANEGFLRTAMERRSILELARLVGYALRPGVASTVYLAYTIDENQKTTVEIPVGTRSQSVPGPGELPQAFETSEVIEARAEWSAIKPRLSRPQYILSYTDTLYLKGIDTKLKPNDPLLVIDSLGHPHFRRVLWAEIEAEAQRTKVILTLNGEFDLELADLEVLVRVSRLPEEEGPYSRAIADHILGEIQAGVLSWIQILRGKNQSVRVQKFEGYKQMTRLEQAIRILGALNFEMLAAWAETALERVKAVLRRLEPKANVTEPPADDKRVINLTAFEGLRNDERTNLSAAEKKKTYAKEIVKSEIDKIRKAGGTIEKLKELVADADKATDEKVAATESENLRLQQLKYVFGTLGFPRQEAWIGDLIQALETAISVSTVAFSLGSFVMPGLLLSKALFIPSLPQLKLTPRISLPSKVELRRPVDVIYAKQSTISTRFISLLGSVSGETLRQAKKNTVLPSGPARVYALRVTASPFGHNAQKQVDYDGNVPKQPNEWDEWPPADDEEPNIIFLDRAYEEIMPGSYIVIRKADEDDSQAQIFGGVEVTIQPRSEYGLNSKSTKLKLPRDWHDNEAEITFIRGTTVYAQSELLELSEETITEDLKSGADTIVLDDLYDGLESGRSLIIAGERTDLEGTSGVRGGERVVLVNTSEDFAKIPSGRDAGKDLPGDRLHTTLHLDSPLTYSYKRDTVTIYGNVVKATHGETRNEMPGNGDGSRAFQSFNLKQPPLTFVSAPNPTGVDSTLHMYVNDIEWHEADTFAGLAQADHSFITRTNDEGKTTVIFGNGKQGSRLPTGAANVRAVYRNGIGKPGNVKAEQINMLVSRPLGVKGVINPLGASGGADKESRDQARNNVPTVVKSLDRLVSLQDYADFARTFAGIGKASAIHLNDGHQQLVHVTIAGLDKDPIEVSSDLFQNLYRALRKFGDPNQFIQLAVREQVLLAMKAYIQIHSDYLWEKVEPKIRARLLDAFSFERRGLSQSIFFSEVVSVIQNTPGVIYVDIELLDTISEEEANDPDGKLKEKLEKFENLASGQSRPEPRIIAKLARFEQGSIYPAQIIFLTPDIPETLILEELRQ